MLCFVSVLRKKVATFAVCWICNCRTETDEGATQREGTRIEDVIHLRPATASDGKYIRFGVQTNNPKQEETKSLNRKDSESCDGPQDPPRRPDNRDRHWQISAFEDVVEHCDNMNRCGARYDTYIYIYIVPFELLWVFLWFLLWTCFGWPGQEDEAKVWGAGEHPQKLQNRSRRGQNWAATVFWVISQIIFTYLR